MPLVLLLLLALVPAASPSPSVAYDDRALVPLGAWRAESARYAHGRTLSVSRARGASLRAPVETVAGGTVTVQVGPRRGVLEVRVAGAVARTLRTAAPRRRLRSFSFAGSGPVALVVRRPGRRGVHVDALSLVPPAPAPPAPPPAPPPQLVVTELMADPTAVPDADGEWLELFNAGSAPADLTGCTLTTQSGAVGALSAAPVPPGGYALLAHSTDPARNGGLAATGTFAGALVNGAGSVTLSCAGTPLDAVSWPLATPGAARQRDPGQPGAPSSGSARWCDAAAPYAGGTDRGSPGSANPPCPGSALGAVQRLRGPRVLGEQLDAAAQPTDEVAGGEAGLHRDHGELDLAVGEVLPDPAAGDDLEGPLAGVDHDHDAARGRDQRVVQLGGERTRFAVGLADEHGELRAGDPLRVADGLVERDLLRSGQLRGEVLVTSGHSRLRPATPGCRDP
jgi:hypothetical protein